MQFSKFVWPLSYSVWDVFNNFLLIDATDRNKISSDQKRFFIALSLYPLSFFANTPFKQYFFRIFFAFPALTKIMLRWQRYPTRVNALQNPNPRKLTFALHFCMRQQWLQINFMQNVPFTYAKRREYIFWKVSSSLILS